MTTTAKAANATTPPATTPLNHSPSEVAWMFVREYYHHLNREPSRLHLFYSKESTIIHGLEGHHVDPVLGQSNIQKLMATINYKDARVVVSNVDSQLSTNNGVLVQVLGELSNHNKPSQKFVQSFFLAKQPTGYFVLNDIFRYLCEEDVDDGEDHPLTVMDQQPASVCTPVADPDGQTDQSSNVEQQDEDVVATIPSREPSPARPVPVVADPAEKDQQKPQVAAKKDAPQKSNAPTSWAKVAQSSARPTTTTSAPAKSVDPVDPQSPKPVVPPPTPNVQSHGHDQVQILGTPGNDSQNLKLNNGGSVFHQDFDKSVWLKLAFPHHNALPVDYILQQIDPNEVQVKSLVYNKAGAVMHLSTAEQARLLVGRRITYNDRDIMIEARRINNGPGRYGSGNYRNNNSYHHHARNNNPQQQMNSNQQQGPHDQFSRGGGGGNRGQRGGHQNNQRGAGGSMSSRT